MAAIKPHEEWDGGRRWRLQVLHASAHILCLLYASIEQQARSSWLAPGTEAVGAHLCWALLLTLRREQHLPPPPSSCPPSALEPWGQLIIQQRKKKTYSPNSSWHFLFICPPFITNPEKNVLSPLPPPLPKGNFSRVDPALSKLVGQRNTAYIIHIERDKTFSLHLK